MPACPACGADLPDRATVCTECGADLDPDGPADWPTTDGTTDRPATDRKTDGTATDQDAEPPTTDRDTDGPAIDPAVDGTETDGHLVPPVTGADYDPEAEREAFERRYGIDLGDRTVGEFIDHLDRQDYSLTPWVWLLAAAEVAGVALFALAVAGVVALGIDRAVVFVAISVLMAAAIFLDTRAVGQFRRWAKIRWVYVLLAAIPFVGHVAGVFYLVLRRLMHERTVEFRRRLLDSGFDLNAREH